MLPGMKLPTTPVRPSKLPKPAQSGPECAPRWLTEQETAQRLGMSQKWLQKARLNGGTLRYAKFGSAVRYARKEDRIRENE